MDSQIQTTDLTKAELTLQLSKEGLAYQQLLQECENVTFTKDNLNEDRGCLTNLRKVKSTLEKMENPHTAKWKAWNDAKKSLADPVGELLNQKVNEFKKLAEEVAEENRKAEHEKQRKADILAEIDRFFIDQSQAVANTLDPDEIVRIEKLVGSNKANKSRYAEFLPLMAEKAAILADLIKTKKNALRELEALKTAENASDDDQAILDLREKQEKVEATIQQAQIDVQERSIAMATKADVVEAEIIIPVAPKARRSTWTWDVVDIKVTAKKMPDWVRMEANVDKVDEYLKAKKAEGIEGEEFEFAGIKFYLNKSY